MFGCYFLILLIVNFMMCYKKIVISITMFFLWFFWYLAFSDEVNTRYTEFYLLSGWEYSNHLIVNLTWGETWYTDLYLENLSDSTFDGKISFVDGSIVNYWSTWVNICKSENEKNIFGQYMWIDNDSFSILSQWSLTKQLNLNFPRRYSGVYYGCVVYYPNISEWSSALNTSVRKAIFLDVNVTPVYSLVGLRVYPWSRGNTTNPNINWFENRWRLLFYNNWDRATVVYSGYVDINNDGSGDMLEGIAWWYYDVVYKWWHQLSSVISGIYITWWQEILLDFTTWTNLYGVENWILYMWWSWYQIGW